MYFKIKIMDQSEVMPLINIVVRIEENMNCWIILCLEHIVTIKLHNYKCVEKKLILPKDTVDQVDLY
jgi:hypothetical protein